MSVFQSALVTGGKERSADSVKGKKLFGQRLVLSEIESLRSRSCIHPAKQVKVPRHLHFFGIVAGVRLNQIEKHVYLAACQRGEALIFPIQRYVAWLVAQFFQRFKNFFVVVLL